MRKCRLVILSLFLFLLFLPGAFGQEQDKLLQLLKQELAYDMKELQKQEFPPYHMNFRVLDDRNVNISSSFGATMSVQDYRTRMLVPQIRLGDTLLDNFKYNYMGTAPDQRRSYRGSLLPLEDENGEDGIRQAIWSEVIKRYNFALDMYEKAKTQSTVSVDNEDKAPCFSSTPVEKYYEAPIPAEKQAIDVKAWEKRLNEVSSIFKESSLLQEGQASLSFRVLRTYFVNTEGTEVVQNRTYARIIISASMKAEDGMDLPLNLSYFAYELKDLPSNERLIADAEDMVKRLNILRTAPVVDPYTGPAILSGPASGVFFHEIFGHRLEGHRMKSGGQTFKKMVGEQVLPTDFQVYSDPTLRQYAGDYMNGFYLYDDEGVKARRVDVVTNGILQEFLMSRVPLEGFPHSNAHGRTAGGGDPVSRQANLVVETTNPQTEAQLRQMLIEEAKKQGKEYGYYFKEVTSGFTFTGEGGSLNSFNVTPLEVYRVYVDGRPDELVRGVDLIGTPLSMFSNIVAGGDRPSVFTGMCGAESGWVPVTASSPMIFVNKIETQRREKSRQLPPILQAPSENKK
ncbi:metallopeptidase TldD-related protein [uncultured Sanguibacteroides sp.]|uniref:TldD/PmbA family protein n=1 Tax=uncultured Sanguibacteroides sp. TaxID=1635151 RepID=UPI0025E58824|nr:metallopeptidase TldD-related protein [uncultured Sanguibacteroides sp.]